MHPAIRSVVLVLLVLLGAGVASTTWADQDQPNVLFIVVDDLNDWIGCLQGHPQAYTPNIDRLAKRGVLFTNAHCAAPACNPSRAAVFSGQRPRRTGVFSNDSKRLLQLHPELMILPKCFAASGYQSSGAGKLLHGGGESKSAFPDGLFPQQRWSPFTSAQVEYTPDELDSKGSNHPRHMIADGPGDRTYVLPLNGMPSDRKPNQPSGESFDWGPIDVDDAAMGDGQIATWASGRLAAPCDKPFFLAVGFYRPHIPLYAPKKYFLRFPTGDVQLPAVRDDDLDDLSQTAKRWALEPITAGRHSTVIQHQQWKSAVAAYLACVHFVDAQIGRLLDALDNSPHADNTIVVLWSDHGWHLGEKQHWGKWTPWERSTRVVLVMAPARNSDLPSPSRGAECDQPVSLLDLYPTLVELCGLAPPSHALDGRSLVPQLSKPAQPTDRAVVTTIDRGNYSVRSGRFRFVRYNDGSEELYDLTADPNEWRNLISLARYSRTVERLRTHLPE